MGDREDRVLVKRLHRFTACKQEDGQMDGWMDLWKDKFKNEKIRKREKNGRTNMMDAETDEWCPKNKQFLEFMVFKVGNGFKI